MGLTDKHLAYGDDIPQTQAEKDYYWELKNLKEKQQQPCEDCISRQELKRKLQEHHDFFINAYGGRVGFKSMADDKEKARVDEINNCIAMVVNELSVTPKEKSEYEHDHEVVKAYNDGQAFILSKIRAEMEQLPTNTRTNWDGCCPDINYPEIEYVDVPKKKLLEIIDKYRAESEEK